MLCLNLATPVVNGRTLAAPAAMLRAHRFLATRTPTAASQAQSSAPVWRRLCKGRQSKSWSAQLRCVHPDAEPRCGHSTLSQSVCTPTLSPGVGTQSAAWV
eukprot:364209-Chlamydomonas_euryale.AAC.1